MTNIYAHQNDIKFEREMKFVQSHFDNFCDNFFSHTHICFYSLSSSFSLYSFYPITKEKKWLSQKLYKIGCTNITPQFEMIIHNWKIIFE